MILGLLGNIYLYKIYFLKDQYYNFFYIYKEKKKN